MVLHFIFVLQFEFMRTRKVQSKIEPELEKHIFDTVPDFKEKVGMSNYIRTALIQKSKFKAKSIS